MRRILLLFVLFPMLGMAASGCTFHAAGRSPERFGFEQVRSIARQRATEPFVSPERPMPAGTEQLTYDDFRFLVFREDASIGTREGTPFRIQFFGRGWLFKVPVEINLIREDGTLQPVRYDPAMFKFEQKGKPVPAPSDLGFAGFKVLHPVNHPGKWDEVAVFLGASYFRALSKGQSYGASARSLGIDTGSDRPEDFPVLTRFWIRQPQRGDRQQQVYALLESPHVTGAYEYTIVPGSPTTITVAAELYARRDVEKLCLAPITSMFLFGNRSAKSFVDFRPEVHDSDVLLVHDAAGRDVWALRPLDNPHQLRTIRQPVKQLRGFGLLQRDRDLNHYQDLEAHYHQRPSVWVEPLGEWGEGQVELFELPSELEYHDNANAYFVPSKKLLAGESRMLRYRVSWISGDPASPVARVINTWRQPLKGSADGREGQWIAPVRYLVDFAGPNLKKLPAGREPQLWVDAGEGKVLGARLERNPGLDGGWRLVFEVDPLGHKTLHLRAGLALDDVPLTETWSEQWDR